MKISYDPKCEELARFFLDAESGAKQEGRVRQLAGVIQKAIEDWMEEHQNGDGGQGGERGERDDEDDFSGQGEG